MIIVAITKSLDLPGMQLYLNQGMETVLLKIIRNSYFQLFLDKTIPWQPKMVPGD